jgi:glyoxylase-like metal-dependent hydrolase (beta-lactamase superfamily II)
VTLWSCRTCAVEYPESDQPPGRCPICSDERQYVLPAGQRWTTLAELHAEGHRGRLVDVEPGITGVVVEPRVGIGQRALIVQTADGNLLWDPVGYLDDDLVQQVRALGGVAAVAASHPHMYGAQVEWSRRFGDVPVWVAAADREWVQREDPVIRAFDDGAEVLPGVRLVRIGGHFPGSAVAHLTGADGRGVLLTGDTVASTPDEHWVAFLRSYPNHVPLSAAVVQTVAARVLALEFDRLYDNFGGRVAADAPAWVARSAERYVGWVRGDFDHLTGTTG